jgi:hypothetical protein
MPLLLDSKQYFFISHMISPTDLFHPPPAPHFNFPGVSDLLPEASKFQHHSIRLMVQQYQQIRKI